MASPDPLFVPPQTNIYFYTIKPILPNQELLVWYCKEFATRLNYPLTGEQMLLKIRKCQGKECGWDGDCLFTLEYGEVFL